MGHHQVSYEAVELPIRVNSKMLADLAREREEIISTFYELVSN